MMSIHYPADFLVNGGPAFEGETFEVDEMNAPLSLIVSSTATRDNLNLHYYALVDHEGRAVATASSASELIPYLTEYAALMDAFNEENN